MVVLWPAPGLRGSPELVHETAAQNPGVHEPLGEHAGGAGVSEAEIQG